jgi:hypothetical protein
LGRPIEFYRERLASGTTEPLPPEKKTPAGRKKALARKATKAFDRRNKILHRLGYRNYGEYLDSQVWRDIRYRVLTSQGRCFICRGFANEVHHRRYTEANLSGETLKGLSPICGDCHRKIQNEGSIVLGPADATKRAYGEKRKLNRSKRPASKLGPPVDDSPLKWEPNPGMMPDQIIEHGPRTYYRYGSLVTTRKR